MPNGFVNLIVRTNLLGGPGTAENALAAAASSDGDTGDSVEAAAASEDGWEDVVITNMMKFGNVACKLSVLTDEAELFIHTSLYFAL